MGIRKDQLAYIIHPAAAGRLYARVDHTPSSLIDVESARISVSCGPCPAMINRMSLP
jgi:hypothetical protein